VVASLVATVLARKGFTVGVLDADITGPSIPKMFGLRGRLEADSLGVYPMHTPEGIGVISMNCLLEREDDAVIWRGPLIGSAISQFWQDGMWGNLDYLLVDLPPGTSDAPLTVLQSLPVGGVVIVSSPQELAQVIVRKAVTMLRGMKVPVAGVVENMGYYACPELGTRHKIFGPSRGAELAAAADAPLLACLPLDPTISELCDRGRIAEYDSPAYRELARSFLEVGSRRLVARNGRTETAATPPVSAGA
jgi:Mrp family chromosome partitioning ATPase